MHPTLTPHKHKDCYEVIMNLSNCHLQNPILKFVGYCNSYKTELNACLQEEFDVIRRAKYEKAKAKRDRYEKLWKEIDEDINSTKQN